MSPERRVWRTVFGLVSLMALTSVGCAGAQASLPYDVADVPTPKRSRHQEAVAIVRLRDGRPASEAPDGDRYLYRGVEYHGTVLDRLGPQPMVEVTAAVGRHLAKAKVFRRVYVVARPEQAPEAELILSGELVRLRGYVETSPAEATPHERRIVAESALNLVLRTRDGTPLGRFDVGFSFQKRVPAEPRPARWTLAARVLRPSLDQLVASLREASVEPMGWAPELEPPAEVPDGAPTSQLQALAPPTWRYAERPARAPLGWAATTTVTTCEHGEYRARQEHRFLRRLGPYQPKVEVWWCSRAAGWRWQASTEFPATFIGASETHRWFVRQIGPSSWRGAPEALADRLRVTPPGGRVLDIPPRRASEAEPRLKPAGVGRI